MKKDIKIEIMRIVACFMVILIHVSASLYQNYDIGSINWHIFNFYDSISRAAVPIFVMISGILLLDNSKKLTIKKLFLRYIPKMIFLLIIWSLVYSLWSSIVLKEIPFNQENIVKATITGPFHLWYISVIIFLYIFTPVLRLITKSDNSLVPKYCFWISLISSFLITIKSLPIIPYHETINQILDKIYLDNIFYWYSYFLLGYYIYKTNILDNYKKGSYLLGIVGLFSCILLTAYTSTKIGENYFELYNYFSFPVLSMSIALIYVMKNIKPNEKNRKLIETISNTTLGIYLIHMISFQFITKVLKYNLAESSILFMIPVISIIVFSISFLLVFIYKKIMDIFKTKRLKNNHII